MAEHPANEARPVFQDTTILVRSARLVVARDNLGRAGAANAVVGRHLPLDDLGWTLLEVFAQPTTVASAASAVGAGEDARARVRDMVARLLAHGLLVEPDEEAYLATHGRRLRGEGVSTLTPPAQSFLHARSSVDTADIVFAGVPFDRSARPAGSAGAPAALRDVSARIPSVGGPFTDRYSGFWDGATETWRLREARLADLGDVAIDADESLEDSYHRIARTLSNAWGRASGLRLALGGDHSITLPVVRSLSHQRVFLVHFDAHFDRGEWGEGGAHHHGNVITRLLGEDLVGGVLQVGVREFAPAWWKQDDRVEVIGAERARRLVPADIVARVPPDLPCHVTIDIDALDPSAAPATGHPLPGGLDLLALEATLEALADERELAGADLVEVMPDLPGGSRTRMSALRLIVRLCDAHLRRRRRRGASPRDV